MLTKQSSGRVLPALMLIGATPMLGSCASRTSIAVSPSVFCQSAQPITLADADTDETIRQVKAHNASYEAVCK